MIVNDIPAIRADQHTFDQAATDSRRANARPVLAMGLASRVPDLCDEVEQLRAELARVNGAFNDAVAELSERYAEIGQLRAENRTLERAVMDSILTARPNLPYRSTTADGLSGVTLAVADGQVLVDGLAHTAAAALELSAAIARAAGASTLTASRTPEEARP